MDERGLWRAALSQCPRNKESNYKTSGHDDGVRGPRWMWE